MQPEQFFLPTIATMALGTALLVPLRDDRLGKRATVGGRSSPLRPDFRAVDATDPENAAQPGAVAEIAAASEPQPDAEAPAVTVAQTIGRRIRAFFAAPAPVAEIREAEPERESESELDGDVTIERSFAQTLDVLLTPAVAPVAAAPVHLVAAPRPALERAVPLTRMPLRPQSSTITWPERVEGLGATANRAERHAYLRGPDSGTGDLLALAYREEDPEGRLLALRALARERSEDFEATVIDALAVGTDEERAFAVDALLRIGRRDAVIPAFRDRIDAIAATAVLGYVASSRRCDYVAALEPFLDRARIETLLSLLAGILE